ncbi:MAG: acetyl-CoA carboxylase carboxyltransferase subunit alpha [Oligoflexales bacterium]
MDYIPLEKPIADLEVKIGELKRLAISQSINLDNEISELELKAEGLKRQLFANLSSHEVAQLSRHPKRPTSLDIIGVVCSRFIELHGDRNFLDDKAIVAGIGRIDGHSCVIIGHQKGKGTKDNILRNFGMPRPEGYRKALRIMSMAERFALPIITLVDTPGAYPGVGAEERGQSEAIAKNIMVMSRLKVPIITFVIGEGGSGGALAIAVANMIHMLEYSIYSVISPEGCASILMKDAGQAPQAAEALKLTAKYALKHNVIDSILKEPDGGAHRDIEATGLAIKRQILADLNTMKTWSPDKLRKHRRDRYLELGKV